MKETITIKDYTEATSNSGKAYLLLETNRGKMSLWDIGESEAVVNGVFPLTLDVELQTKGKYTNVIKVYGVSTTPFVSASSYKEDTRVKETEAIGKMSQLKSQTNMKCSALDNATKICIARGETTRDQVLAEALEYLKFLES